MQGNIQFFKGEKKYVSCEVIPKNSAETVVITSVVYELATIKKKQIIETGACTIEGNKAQVLLDMDERGSFLLTFTAVVGPETIKASAIIDVL